MTKTHVVLVLAGAALALVVLALSRRIRVAESKGHARGLLDGMETYDQTYRRHAA